MKQFTNLISNFRTILFSSLLLFSFLDNLSAQNNINYTNVIYVTQKLDLALHNAPITEHGQKNLSEEIFANCKDRVTSDTKTANWGWRAKGKAKNNWRGKVKDLYGKKWEKWRKAQNKDWNCYGPAGSAACVVKAEPCK